MGNRVERESRAFSEVRRPYKPSLSDVTLGRRQSRAKKPAHQSRGANAQRASNLLGGQDSRGE